MNRLLEDACPFPLAWTSRSKKHSGGTPAAIIFDMHSERLVETSTPHPFFSHVTQCRALDTTIEGLHRGFFK